jgi:hypothetical protein
MDRNVEMKPCTKSESAFYLVTYAPLASSKPGRAAMEQYGLPPFVDGSIRREPDLEHTYPAISCLCRAGKFAPRLKEGDFVGYMTRKARYGANAVQRRLTAIVQVHRVLESHKVAAEWYRNRRLDLPHNCVVPGNPPLALDQSHQQFSASHCASDRQSDRQTHREWEAEYRLRAKNYPTFVVCVAIHRNVSWTAPLVSDKHLRDAFGKIPGSQNPGELTLDDLRRFVRVLKLPVPPFFE